jgi:hypothetical protein
MPTHPTLFTIDQVKAVAQITATDWDAIIPGLIATVEHQLEQFTGLTLFSRSATVRIGGKWRDTLFLPGRPISAVTLVRIWQSEFGDGVWEDPGQVNFMGQNASYAGTPPAALILGVDYGLKFDKQWNNRQYSLCGMVIRNGRVWPGATERKRGRMHHRRVDGRGNIEVQYTYGFVESGDVPPVFLSAVAAGVQAFIQRIPAGGLVNTSNSLDGASVGLSLDTGSLDQASGLYAPEVGSLRSALMSYVAPRVF